MVKTTLIGLLFLPQLYQKSVCTSIFMIYLFSDTALGKSSILPFSVAVIILVAVNISFKQIICSQVLS